MEKKDIALFELIQIGEHLLSGEARMPGEDTVGGAAADRKGGAQQVSDTPSQ